MAECSYIQLRDVSFESFLKFDFTDDTKALALQKTTTTAAKKQKILCVVDRKSGSSLTKIAKFVEEHQTKWWDENKETRVQLEKQSAHLHQKISHHNQGIHLTNIKFSWFYWDLRIVVDCETKDIFTFTYTFSRLTTKGEIAAFIEEVKSKQVKISYPSKESSTATEQKLTVMVVPYLLYQHHQREGFPVKIANPDKKWLKDSDKGEDRTITLRHSNLDPSVLHEFIYKQAYKIGYQAGYDEGYRNRPRPVATMVAAGH